MNRVPMAFRATLAYAVALIIVTLATAELFVVYGVDHPCCSGLQNHPALSALSVRTAARLTAAANFLPNVLSYGVVAYLILRWRAPVRWSPTIAVALLCAVLTPLLWFGWMLFAIRPWPILGGGGAMFFIWLIGASFGPGAITAQILRWPSPSAQLARF